MAVFFKDEAKGIMKYGTAQSQTSVLLWIARLNPATQQMLC